MASMCVKAKARVMSKVPGPYCAWATGPFTRSYSAALSNHRVGRMRADIASEDKHCTCTSAKELDVCFARLRAETSGSCA